MPDRLHTIIGVIFIFGIFLIKHLKTRRINAFDDSITIIESIFIARIIIRCIEQFKCCRITAGDGERFIIGRTIIFAIIRLKPCKGLGISPFNGRFIEINGVIIFAVTLILIKKRKAIGRDRRDLFTIPIEMILIDSIAVTFQHKCCGIRPVNRRIVI